jgi:polyhydroxybutyrate depolymerase
VRARLAAAALAVLLVPAAARAVVPIPRPIPMRWTIDGVERRALVYPPAIDRGRPAPAVFAFHGHGGNPRRAAREMQIQDSWPDAVVVYPQGLPTASAVDPKGRFPGWQRTPGEDGDRDLKFFDAALATVRARWRIDPDRIYAAGFSNGAIFTYLLWAERAPVFAAFAACAGKIWPPTAPDLPKPLVVIAGERDRVLPVAEQREAIRTACRIDGCVAQPRRCGPMCESHRSSRGAPVETWIHPGGHVFPPWAGAAVVRFFRDHPRRR